jgi:regulator of PEP synthase PpsR (kinase-PPPase family)
MAERRTVYLISDHTGITVETMGKALLSQFEGQDFDLVPWPFIDSLEKAQRAAQRIREHAQTGAQPPIVFSTLVDPSLRTCFKLSGAMMLDFFAAFTPRLEEELGIKSTPLRGRHHSMENHHAYEARIRAMNFALANDDGVSTKHYPAAELILIGVSRSGKTPTCLFLGLQHGMLAANYPLTEDDLLDKRLPKSLRDYRQKLIGLSIKPQQLHRIRQERRPNSRYASMEQCRMEARLAEDLFKLEGIPYLETTAMSIEEIAARIVHRIRS